MNFLARWLILACVLAVGCNSSKPSAPKTTNSEDGNTSAVASSSVRKIIPVVRDRKDVIGNWVVVVTIQQADNYRWILNFSRADDGKIVAKFVDTTNDKDEHDKPELAETEVNGNSVRLVIKNPHGSFDIDAQFEDGFIRGTVRSSPMEFLLVRLLPTEESSLEKFLATGLPPGGDALQAKLKSKEVKPEDLLNIAREYRTSPITQDIYGMVVNAYAQQKVEEAKFKALIDEFIPTARIWGERWEARMEMTVAVNLINTRVLSRMAIEHLDAAEKKLGADLADTKNALDAYRDAANTNIRILDISSATSTDEVKTQAYAELTELLKKQPFHAEILWAVASHARKLGDIDKAIDCLSDLCALPMLEAIVIRGRADQPPDPPNELLKKLWTEKYGKEDGFQEHLVETYNRKIDALIAESQQKSPAVPAADAGNRTVLMELFTGMMNPNAVAADLMFSGITKTYPPTEVIAIRYHQHMPLPDGLANRDSEERGAFYEITATPSIIMDGMKTDNRFYSGPTQAFPSAYAMFRTLIDQRLAEKTDVALKLSAVVTDGQLTVTGEATGISEELLPSCRLRLAIVENEIDTFMPLTSNGIYKREFVVRELLGGSNGILPKKGTLKYSTTIPFEDLQKHVADYITSFEAGRRASFLPEMKPPIKGALSLVGWVQNGTLDPTTHAKLVLQSALVPVTGDAAYQATVVVTDSKAPTEVAPAATTQTPPAATPPAASPDAASVPPAQERKSEASESPPAPALPE